MKNKIGIIAMAVVAMALVTGCEDKAASSTQIVSEAQAPDTETQAQAATASAPAQGTETQALIEPETAPALLSTEMSSLSATTGIAETITFAVKNTSQVEFLARNLTNEKNNVEFIIDTVDTDGKLITRAIMPLPTSLAAGKEATYQISFILPSVAGNYTLEINMVQDEKFYFKDVGVKSIQIPLTVKTS